MRNFAVKRGKMHRVCMHRFRAPAGTFFTTTRDALCWDDFYALQAKQPPEVPREFMEDVLGRIEAAALPLIRRIIGGHSSLDDTEREHIAWFVSALELRSPRVRQQNNEIHHRMIQQLVQTSPTVDEDAQDKGFGLTVETKAAVQAGDVYTVIPREWHIKQMGELIPEVARALQNMHLTVIRAQDEFVISDSPVLRTLLDPTVASDPMLGSLGLANPEIALIVPLGSLTAISYSWKLAIPEVRFTLQQVAETNTLQCVRCAIGCVSKDRAFAWIDKDGTIQTDCDTARSTFSAHLVNRRTITVWPETSDATNPTPPDWIE